MQLNRRQFLGGLLAAIPAVTILHRLPKLPTFEFPEPSISLERPFSVAAMSAALREVYDDELLREIIYSEKSMLKMVSKENNWMGGYIPVPFCVG